VTSPAYQGITGLAKLAIIVGYLLLIRRMPEVRRVFQYHGAEHKTITTYEAGEDLIVDNARPKTTAHPRCGTTFLVMVALVSVIIFSVAGAFFPRVPGGRVTVSVSFFLMKLPFLPLVATCLLESLDLLARACDLFCRRAVEGIEANEAACRKHVENSTAAATALVPLLGYEGASSVVKQAQESRRTIREVVLDEADEMLDFGFREELELLLNATPPERRTMMFSATLPKAILGLARLLGESANDGTKAILPFSGRQL